MANLGRPTQRSGDSALVQASSLLITVSQSRRLKALSKRTGVPMSVYLRRAVERVLDEEEAAQRTGGAP